MTRQRLRTWTRARLLFLLPIGSNRNRRIDVPAIPTAENRRSAWACRLGCIRTRSGLSLPCASQARWARRLGDQIPAGTRPRRTSCPKVPSVRMRHRASPPLRPLRQAVHRKPGHGKSESEVVKPHGILYVRDACQLAKSGPDVPPPLVRGSRQLSTSSALPNSPSGCMVEAIHSCPRRARRLASNGQSVRSSALARTRPAEHRLQVSKGNGPSVDLRESHPALTAEAPVLVCAIGYDVAKD
jgi:hypothetical protein